MTVLDSLQYELKKLLFVKKEFINDKIVVRSEKESIEANLSELCFNNLSFCTFIKICTRINKESK